MSDLPQRPVLDEDWRDQAACRGMDTNLFFPERGHNATDEVKAACASCPVAQQCLDYAMALGDRFGIWGGTSDKQRRVIRRTDWHGTASGYRMHHLEGTQPCERCRAAYNEWHRHYKARKRAEIAHGTNAGYSQHVRQGDKPCAACREAHTAYQQGRRAERRAEDDAA